MDSMTASVAQHTGTVPGLLVSAGFCSCVAMRTSPNAISMPEARYSPPSGQNLPTGILERAALLFTSGLRGRTAKGAALCCQNTTLRSSEELLTGLLSPVVPDAQGWGFIGRTR